MEAKRQKEAVERVKAAEEEIKYLEKAGLQAQDQEQKKKEARYRDRGQIPGEGWPPGSRSRAEEEGGQVRR